ncbi:hypothetical protein HHI36_012649 [Cryptolaemus montrouzieri]|uniref:HTH psq-type domain-containing protein n=1 Tax=Cryptolaemus montrouzieri TaxID=559131 RepID=A0ABD2NFF0_9CUCU
MGPRKQWSQIQLENALKAINEGQSQRAASKEFKVPRRTLKRYLDNEAIHESAFAPSLPSQKDMKRSILNNSPTPNTQDQVLPDYDTHLSSDEDDMTLAVIAHRTKKNSNHLSPDIDKNVLNTSFKEMLPTPLNPTKTVAIRKKH